MTAPLINDRNISIDFAYVSNHLLICHILNKQFIRNLSIAPAFLIIGIQVIEYIGHYSLKF